jgi:hypothetical protein
LFETSVSGAASVRLTKQTASIATVHVAKGKWWVFLDCIFAVRVICVVSLAFALRLMLLLVFRAGGRSILECVEQFLP